MKNLLFENIISKFAKPYSEKSNATRCRCILLNKDEEKLTYEPIWLPLKDIKKIKYQTFIYAKNYYWMFRISTT